jgi:hypothetical protein
MAVPFCEITRNYRPGCLQLLAELGAFCETDKSSSTVVPQWHAILRMLERDHASTEAQSACRVGFATQKSI